MGRSTKSPSSEKAMMSSSFSSTSRRDMPRMEQFM